jgi:hypothetical protein
MNRSAVARRYAPLVLLAAVQLIIITLLPSTAPATQRLATGTSTGPGGSSSAGAIAGPGGSAAAPGAAGGPGNAAGTGGGVGGAGAEAGTGDTSHCVGDRQFDPVIDFFASACVGKWGGGDNGGATYQGVTADSIKVIEYIPQSNPAVQSIAEAAGLYVSPEKLQAFRSASEKFINEHFELYGRKVQIETADGTCSITPPDVACLRNDFRRIIKDRQPFAILWVVGGCSACFDEMSQLQTVNLGGLYFSDEFSRARAPYHWDAQQSGTLMNAEMGQFWCANLAHQPAQYALNQPGNMNGKTRRLGVIALNDPEMEATVQAAKAELAKCGDQIAAEYYYAADLTTAAQQVAAGIAKMQAAGVTSIYYLNDIAGPGYFMGAQQSTKYYVENIMSGAGTQDNDKSAKQMQSNPIACPNGPPCPFETSFGLSTAVYEPIGADVATRVWQAAGNDGPAPYEFAALGWGYYSMLATLMQAAGPNLTPQNMDAGVRAYGLRGDADHVLRGFPDGSYSWGHDMGMQYWNKDTISPYDGGAGAWIKVGSRSPLNGWTAGGLGQLPDRG